MPAIAEDVRREMLDAEVEAAGLEAVALYQQILANGETAEWAAMCALQSAPGSKNTDRALCEGGRQRMESMDDFNRNKILAIAKKAGINTQGKFYKAGLGRYNDPRAWVASQDDILATAKAKKLKVEGVVNCDYSEPLANPPKKAPMPEDIIKREALGLMRKDPALAAKVKSSPKAKQELRERIVATHSRKS